MYPKEQLAIKGLHRLLSYKIYKNVNQILPFADISRYTYEIPQKREMCTYLIVESVFIIGSQWILVLWENRFRVINWNNKRHASSSTYGERINHSFVMHFYPLKTRCLDNIDGRKYLSNLKIRLEIMIRYIMVNRW